MEKYIGGLAVVRREEQRGAFETTKYCLFVCLFLCFCARFFGIWKCDFLLRCESGRKRLTQGSCTGRVRVPV